MSKAKVALGLVVVAVAVAAYAPFYKGADQFRPAIRSGLEASLQRKVESGPVCLVYCRAPLLQCRM